jgi:hypothetical protein
VLGPDHLITLTAAGALTHALVELGEVKPARALSQDTLQRSRRLFGPDHPITLFLAQATGIGHLMQSDDAVADPRVNRCERCMHRMGPAAGVVKVMQGQPASRSDLSRSPGDRTVPGSPC